MKFFSSFAASFCAACVFIGAIYMLCPQGVISRSVKYILSLCFILSVISAAAITVDKWEFSAPQSATVNTEIGTLDQAAAEYVYAYALSDAQIEYSKITVCTDKTENGSIVINKVIIYSDCEKARIIAALGEAAEKIEVEVIND